jgi:hypothetical protein
MAFSMFGGGWQSSQCSGDVHWCSPLQSGITEKLPGLKICLMRTCYLWYAKRLVTLDAAAPPSRSSSSSKACTNGTATNYTLHGASVGCSGWKAQCRQVCFVQQAGQEA